MKNANKPFTVKKGRHGFNGDLLASITQKEALEMYKKLDPKQVKEAHAEAVQTKKENDKAAK